MARIFFEGKHVQQALSTGLPNPHQGGTNFDPPLREASSVIKRYAGYGYTPMLVFMSDGEDEGGRAAIDTLAAIRRENERNGLQVYTIPFGSSGSARLRELANAGGGYFRPAATGDELSRVFSDIAAGCNAMDGLIKAFGDIITSMVVQKLLLDYY